MSLAQYTVTGCPTRFPDGTLGQVIIQGPSGPQWSGPSGILIADAGGYFTTDNVEAALQQLGAGLIPSDVALKGMFVLVDGQDLLQRLLNTPITTYRRLIGEGTYQDRIHIGPTAQDWDAAFSDLLGRKMIKNVVDGQEVATPAIAEDDKIGVLLAAVQALGLQIIHLKAEIQALGGGKAK